MYGLTSTLSTASEALGAAGGAIAVTNNNIANVNTPGYSRQTVNLSATALQSGGSFQDGGVSFGGYHSVRNEVLQLSINQKSSDVASLAAQSTLWSQVETGFSSTNTGLGAAVNTFFSSVSGLSTSPNDPATRQTALASASQLVAAFHQASDTLSQASTQANTTAAGTVQNINQLTKEIADLNAQLSVNATPGQDGGSLQDQRDALTSQLAKLTGLTSVQTESSPSLSLSDGSPLVIGSTAYSLQLAEAPDGSSRILNAQGTDVTDAISGGTLGGALSMRDKQLPSLAQSLNQFATDFSNAMNTAQQGGFDLSGGQGQPMFAVAPNAQGSAAGLTLSLSSAAGIATSSNGAANSSGNVTQMLAVATQKLSSGGTPIQTYAGLVQGIGTLSSQTTASQTATQASLDQLTTIQSSESGVSIDEETTNLLRYQQAYSAAAQVISTLNTLFSAVLSMGGAN